MELHVEAELFVLPESEGGRKSPFFSGYRPQFRFRDRDNDVNITILDREQLDGGDSGNVALTFVRPDLQIGRLFIGAQFGIAEGARVVARGTITRILDTELIADS
ncbi:MAG: hypothetical protein IH991_10325 [Planctomycetes bacterium]|nr:hypothetical protein [Planctomycetota bacterium]